jgi:diguanylate cyclase (GGDEF)-like protein
VTPYAQLETALRLYEQAAQQAQRDSLTGLLNHACFKEHLNRHFQEARRYDRPLSLMMLDLDHFKRINDTQGHPVGDEVLKAVAATVGSNIRDCDYAYRYGGEELALLLPETSEEQATLLAERLRRQIRGLAVGNGVNVSASFGVAQIESCDACGEDLLMRTDQALYQAKAMGRDQVCSHRGDQPGSILISR